MFITFEGLDGSGKTTQIKRLAAQLQQRGYDVLLTREPGGTPIGEQIRDILKSQANTAMHPLTELLLFNAARAQIVAEVLRPHLASGGLVICDRFADSTVAYQGYGRGLDTTALHTVIELATGGLKPDLTVYLDVDPTLGLRRRQMASLFGEEFDRLDDEELAFYQRVQRGYEDLIAREPERFVRVNADQAEERVYTAVFAAVQSRLGQLV